MADGLINVDKRGEVQHELAARVVLEDGRPKLEPVPGTVGRWRTLLTRHVDKGALRLTLSRVSQRRSYAQNRLLWHVYGQILQRLREVAMECSEECPFRDDEDLHEAMKHLFIGVTVRRFRGEEIEIPPTTTKLTIEQFSAFLEAIVGYWSQRGVYVEMPDAA